MKQNPNKNALDFIGKCVREINRLNKYRNNFRVEIVFNPYIAYPKADAVEEDVIGSGKTRSAAFRNALKAAMAWKKTWAQKWAEGL